MKERTDMYCFDDGNGALCSHIISPAHPLIERIDTDSYCGGRDSRLYSPLVGPHAGQRFPTLAAAEAALSSAAATPLLLRLEEWRNGHKSRSAQIAIDDGYGATCWTVDLGGNGKTVHAAEVSFSESEDNGAPENVVFVAGEGNDWPGLHATLATAMDLADKLGL
jgi:hypothetical protein